MDYYDTIVNASDFLKKKLGSDFPKMAIVMGSGLSEIFSSIEITDEVSYDEIIGFPRTTVTSHTGKLIVGVLGDTPVLIMAGRWHYYEGYSTKELTLPIYVLKQLGIEKIIFTNVSGGVNPDYEQGDIVLIKDHINMIPDNPLRGTNDRRLGIRFPDMLHTYDIDMRNTLHEAATSVNISLKEGVYLALPGPSLETPAEYTMAYRLGADLVGMSTVPEVIAARHASITVAAVSIVSNVCYPISRLTETTIEDVVEVAQQSGKKLAEVLKEMCTETCITEN